MEEENDGGDNLNIFNDNRSSAEKITNDVGALRCILSKMEFDDLLRARLVCKIWNKETGFFIKKRINWINFAKDSRLEQYLKSEDRYLFPSIKLELGKLSTKVLAQCDLEGVQNLCLRGIGGKRYNGRVPDWSKIWNIKEKILRLFQQPNNVNSLELHFNFPVNFTNTEADFVHNFINLHTLSIKQVSCSKKFGPNDMGTILVNRCPTLNYLNIELNKKSYWRSPLSLLVLMLNERKNNGHSNPIVSILPKLCVFPTKSHEFMELANTELLFESLELFIDCTTTDGTEPDQNDMIRLFGAVETLVRNSAGVRRQLDLGFKNMTLNTFSLMRNLLQPREGQWTLLKIN